MLACQIGGCKNGLSTGKITLIVIGSIIVVIFVVMAIYKLANRKK